MSSPFEGYYVVAKWYDSKAPSGKVNLISRSLGKFSIVDNSYQGPQIQDQDVYLCRITKEIKPGTNTGAFVLLPVRKLDPDTELRKLIPGFYDLEIVGRNSKAQAAVVRPNSDKEQFWLLSKATRQVFSSKYYAIIIPIEVSDVGP